MGDLVYAASCSGFLYALDRHTGEERWKREIGTTFHGEPVVAGDRLMLTADGGFVFAFELATGETVWQTPVPPPGALSDLVEIGGRIAGQDAMGGVFALDPATGEIAWSFSAPELDGDRDHLRPPATDGERLFVALAEGVVYALSPAGEPLWRLDLGASPTTAVVHDAGSLWLGDDSKRLLGIDAATGEIAAELELSARPNGTPVLTGDSLIVAAGPSLVVAVDRGLEGERWRLRSDAGWTTPRPLFAGGRVIVGSGEGELVAVEAASGERAWRVQLEGTLRGTSWAGGTLYVGTLGGDLFAVRPPAPAAEPPAPAPSR